MISDIKKYSFKQGLAHEFELIKIKSLYNESEEKLTKPHRTGFYHMIWFQRGNPTHLVDFNPISIKPNTVLFLNKDAVHRFDTKGNFDGKVILFTDSFFSKTEEDGKFLRSSILFNDMFSATQIQLTNSDIIFKSLTQQIEAELKSAKDNYQSDILHNLLHNLLLHSEREKRKQNYREIKKSIDGDYLLLFKDLLEAQFKTQKQVSGYAKQLSVREKRLNQATSKIIGKSPKQMIDDRIMLEAKRLLAHTNETVKEIGFALGFDEPTYFIKYFRKHSSFTPIEFREQFGQF